MYGPHPRAWVSGQVHGDLRKEPGRQRRPAGLQQWEGSGRWSQPREAPIGHFAHLGVDGVFWKMHSSWSGPVRVYEARIGGVWSFVCSSSIGSRIMRIVKQERVERRYSSSSSAEMPTGVELLGAVSLQRLRNWSWRNLSLSRKSLS